MFFLHINTIVPTFAIKEKFELSIKKLSIDDILIKSTNKPIADTIPNPKIIKEITINIFLSFI